MLKNIIIFLKKYVRIKNNKNSTLKYIVSKNNNKKKINRPNEKGPGSRKASPGSPSLLGLQKPKRASLLAWGCVPRLFYFF